MRQSFLFERCLRAATFYSMAKLMSRCPDPEERFSQPLSHRNHLSEGVSGALAGVAVTALLYPVDTVKVLLQTATTGSLPSVVLSAISRHGLRIFYAGATTSLITSACFSAVYTTSFESAKSVIAPFCPDHQWLAHCVAGGLASVATSFGYTPAECIKSRLQSAQYTNWWVLPHFLR